MTYEIIKLLKEGYTITETAKIIKRSTQSIHLHLKKLRKRYNCKTNFQLMSVV